MLNKRILVLMFLLLFLPLVGCLTEPNQRPIITSDPVKTATVGLSYTYDVEATDPDEDTLTYFLTKKPTGMFINSATGLISWKPIPVQIGDNSVIVTVSDGSLNITQSFTITVSKPAPTPVPVKLTKIVVDPKTMSLFVEKFDNIKSVTAHFSNGSTKDIALSKCTYTSSATGFATVSTAGLVTAVAEGTATITVTYAGKTDTVGVTVNPVLLTSIVVVPKVMDLIVGETEAIKSVTAHYSDGSIFVINQQGYDYGCGSSDETIATVSTAGLVTAVATGTTTITVGYVDKTDTIEVTVNPIRLTSIVVLPETMLFSEKQKSHTIESITAHYNNGAKVEIDLDACDYESSNNGVAEVYDGVVKPVTTGTATITVSYTEEEITKAVLIKETDTVEVTVGPVHNINANRYYYTITEAITDALAGDTIEVAAGNYPENVVIPVGKDNLQLIGSGSDVTSIAPASGRAVALNGKYGLVDGIRIQGFTLVTADDSHAFIALSGTVVLPSTTNLKLKDIVIDGGQRGIGLNAVQGVTLTNVYLSNISGSPEAALELTGVFDLTFIEGSIEENNIGIRLQMSPAIPPYGPNGNIHIHDSVLSGNVTAIENQDASTIIDATNNWWGDESGPYHAVTNPDGLGNAVSDFVNYGSF